MIYQYVCKFYLNASHYIYIQDKKGEPHSHCFEFVIDIGTKDKTSFVSFTEIEKSIEAILQPYQEQLLNEVNPFDEINPTLENIAGYFENVVLEVLIPKNWILLTLEVSETPTRSYLINVVEDVVRNKVQDRKTNEILDEPKNRVSIETHNLDTINKVSLTNATGFVENKKIKTSDEIPNRYSSEIWDAKRGKHVTIYKNENPQKCEFDWIIPDELMHFDYERKPRK